MKIRYITFENIFSRLKSESPTFFNKLRGWSASIAVLGTALAAAKNQYPEFMLFLSNDVIGYVITAGIAIAFVASLTVANPKENDVK